EKIARKLAVARAIISGGEAAVHAWDDGMAAGTPYAPITAAAYTAASLAKTGAMISSIKGGSKPSAGGSALPSVSTPAAQAPAAQAQQEPSRNISINLTGSSMFSADSVRELIEQINGQVGDGVNLVTG
ncbi:MAG: hypothetical protein GY822_09875, partial [Deltaproteobacteria bacterium]|nr:hypothetical protein [Deltaproteobacteria bacterium]